MNKENTSIYFGPPENKDTVKQELDDTLRHLLRTQLNPDYINQLPPEILNYLD